jgi:hypothetical protein
MGKKTKNKKINKNLIPTTTDSACLNNILFEFEAHISKLEGQLHKDQGTEGSKNCSCIRIGEEGRVY